MAISIGSDSLFLRQAQSSKASARAEKLSSSLDSIAEGNATDEELMEACKSFESYLVEQVIKSTKNALLENEDEEGEYMKFFGDTMTQEYAKIVTENSELGIAQMLYDSMKRNS